MSSSYTAPSGQFKRRPKKSWRDVLPVHPAADLFPLMSHDELIELGEDIKRNGLTSPIVLWRADDNAVPCLLDGRNRLDAIEAVTGHPVWVMLDPVLNDGTYVIQAGQRWWLDVIVQGPVDPYEYVLSANIHRRHLTAEQKRKLIANVLEAKPEASNNSIAKQVKADDKTVASVSRERRGMSCARHRRSHPEDDIQRCIVAHLRQRGVPGLVFWHTPNGAKLGGKINAKGIAIQGARLKGLGVRAGVSDIIAIHQGQIFALEIKAPGGRPTEAQLEFIDDMRNAGAFTSIAEGLDQAIRTIEMWGLVRGCVS
jgi:hypothetical protein